MAVLRMRAMPEGVVERNRGDADHSVEDAGEVADVGFLSAVFLD